MLNIRSIVREKSLEENINKLFARQIWKNTELHGSKMSF
jgi:hypothetical protein